MMERLVELGEQLAAARQADAIDAVAGAVKAALPGGTVEVGEEDVTVVGRGLLRQWLESADLRFLSGALR